MWIPFRASPPPFFFPLIVVLAPKQNLGHVSDPPLPLFHCDRCYPRPHHAILPLVKLNPGLFLFLDRLIFNIVGLPLMSYAFILPPFPPILPPLQIEAFWVQGILSHQENWFKFLFLSSVSFYHFSCSFKTVCSELVRRHPPPTPSP